MAMLKNLSIRNFRGFEKLDISDFGKINIFVGQNDCGKTTILEAITVMRPASIAEINSVRRLDYKSVEYLFYKLNLDSVIRLDGAFVDGTGQHIKIKISGDRILPLKNNNDSDNLEIYFSVTDQDGSTKENTMKAFYSQQPVKLDLGNKFYPAYDITYVNAESRLNSVTAKILAQLMEKKQIGRIVEFLSYFNPDIKDLKLLSDNEIFLDVEGFSKLVSVNTFGDGLKQYLEILATVARGDNCITLIDEIENGLHYSAHRKLWRNLINVMKSMNNQIFVTTHSLETLSCLKEVLDEADDEAKGMFRLYNIAKTSTAGFQAYAYSYEAFKDAIEFENELRG